MNCALFVRLGDMFGKQNTLRKVLGYLARNEVALCSRGAGVLVGVLLHNVFIGISYKRKYTLVRSICLTD